MNNFNPKNTMNIFRLCAMLFLSATAVVRAETIFWSDSFETNSPSRWTTNSVWKIGSPTYGPGNTHSGVNCAATGLKAYAPANADARFICTNYNGATTLTVPSADQFPRLRFWQWFNFVNSLGFVEIQAAGSTNWQTLSITNLSSGSTANSCGGAWSRPSIDLSAFAGQQVQIAFHFISSGSGWGNDPGWYIDDVAVVTGTPVLNDPESFESGAGDWSVDSGTWEIGQPTSGPNSGHSGTNCVGTILAGNYGWNVNTRLISPTFAVPASGNSVFRFWQWYSFVNAGGYVEIKAGTNSWQTISVTNMSSGSASVTSGGWINTAINVSAYAGQNVQIAFHFMSWGSGWGNAPGWYIDDIDLDTAAPVLNNPESFESGAGDWSVNSGNWQIGVPTSGPNSAHSGTNCAGTVLSGNYSWNMDTRLISPLFTVPTISSPKLSFWQWYSFVNAGGYVEIKAGTNRWQTISVTNMSSGSASVTSGGWINTAIDLSAYVGQTVQIAFHFFSGGSGWGNAPGWYIDDITFPNNPAQIDISAPINYTYPGGSSALFTINRSGGLNGTLNVNLALGGTAVAGTDYVAIPTNITFAADVTSSYLLVTLQTNAVINKAKTVVLGLLTNAYYLSGLTTNAVITLLPANSATNLVTAPVGRYWRGSGGDPSYWSQVIPLDYEKGAVYSNLNGNCSTLFSGLTSWSSPTFYHYNATNSLPQTNTTNRIAFNNPIVAFGERTGGTPLYFSQPYNFGIYAGDPLLAQSQIVIQVYYRTNLQLAGAIEIVPPNYSDTNSMSGYVTNAFQVTTNAFGLTTTLSDSPNLYWGTTSLGAYVLTHTASSQSTNYYYLVEASGYPNDGSDPMAITVSGAVAPSLLYTLEFEAQPPWRSTFLDQPHFDGSPLPPFYAGKTLAEMLTNTPPVTNVVNFTPSAATSLDDSPELRRHPILDNFVASLGNDPDCVGQLCHQQH
jgi:hypothetical protein